MKTSVTAPRRRVSSVAISLFMMAVSVVFGGWSTCAQTESVRDGSTPSALAAGSPAGSYSLSGFETVSPYNGSLNFSLPLYKVGGRGGAGYAVTLRIDQKWSISKEINPGQPANFTPRAGWLDEDGGSLEQTYGVGKLTVRHGASRDYYTLSPCGTVSRVTLTRLSFTAPDGTEYELRDKQWGGAPHVVSPTACEPQYNRGRVFVTADGSSATFIADSDIKDAQFGSGEGVGPMGVMILKDGTRIHVGSLGRVDWMRDRNGNLVTFAYTPGGVLTVTDPLGRTVTITEGSPVVISYKGFGGADRTIKIYTGQLSTALRSGSQLQTQGTLFPGINNPAGATNCNPQVITSVELPDQRTYQFRYDSYGELARVVLPTGGAFEYDYAAGLTDGVASGMFDANNQKQVYRRVVERRVYPSGGTDTAYTVKQVYSRPESSTAHSDVIEVKQCTSGPSVGTCGTGAALLSRELHYYYGSPRLSFGKQPYEYTGWQEGKEYRTETYDPQSNALLRKVETTWQQPADGQTWPLTTPEADGSAKPNNPQVTAVQTTLADTSQITAQTYSYDQYGNGTDTYEYDYSTSGSGVPGPFVRRTHTDYATAAAYVNSDVNPALGAGLRGLPIETWVSSDIGGASKVSRASYVYDQYALTDPGVTGHDAAYGTGFLTRGNLTGTTRYLNPIAQSGGVTTTATYDVAGNMTSATDALGRTSYVYYNDKFSDGNDGRGTYAFPTGTQSAVPDPTGQYGSASALTTSTQYDFSSGLPVLSKDANGRPTSFEYGDVLDRLTKVARPDGGWTSYEYGRNQWGDFIYTRTLLNASGATTYAYQYADRLGRTYRSFAYDPTDAVNAWLTTDTLYDSMGRVWKVSNPYRSVGAASEVNPPGRWTTNSYDDIGRVKSVTPPDGATVTTNYVGNTATVTDAAGKQRISKSDALGRLTEVWEATPNDVSKYPGIDSGSFMNADGTTVTVYGYRTNYTYDALGNLRKVDQGGQLRYFMYDSLSRLVRAKNPEQAAGSAVSNITDPVTGNSQWSVGYGYDDNGNLTVRTDARNVTTTYAYDALNRNTAVFYSDNTMGVGRAYDNNADNGLGRLTSDWTCGANGCGSVNSYNYDVVGRAYNKNQYFWAGNAWSQPYSTSYAYDRAGNVTAVTYPSGHTVNYNYDAAGRTAGFAGNLGDGVQRTYSTGVTYDEMGGMRREQFGTQTPLYHKLHYNVRGQVYAILLSSVNDDWNWNRGMLANHYGSNDFNVGWGQSGPNNNGNVLRSHHYVPNDDQVSGYTVFFQDYEYDSLNRLSKVTETNSVTWQAQYAQKYEYDRWGNRTIKAGQTWSAPEPQFELRPQANQEVAEPSNRLYAPGDSNRAPSQKLMRYDAAGNLVYDAHTGQGARIYDAENRMTQAQDVHQQWSTYTYDADGRRVKRLSAGQETWQVYGVGGELLAEYQAGAATFLAAKEYGYRSGKLLVTMSSGDTQRLRRFIRNLYYNCLARDPNPAESQQKTDQLAQAGVQGEESLLTAARLVARGLFESPDYAARNRTNIEYVTDLYNSYLQRAPDTDGLSFWVQDAQNNGRAHTLTSFEVSTEFATLSATVYGTAREGDGQRVNHFVDQFYLGAYGGFPAEARRQQQAQRLNGAAALGQERVKAEARLMGVEIFQASNYNSTHSDTQYVTDLYEAFLQRAPDGLGMSFWVSKVQSEGRASALAGFQSSEEFGELAGTLYRETFWLMPDQLGTPRMVVDKSGSLTGIKRHDYLPFGEEIGVVVGGRATSQGYSVADDIRQKFTNYEHDGETGLHYAKARYYYSAAGRFTSVDPMLASAKANQPQSWNHYTYVLGNPLLLVDPSGLVWAYTMTNNGNTRQYQWYGDESDVPKDATILKNRGDFYVEGEVDGRWVGVRFNPNGPKSWLTVGLEILCPLIETEGSYYSKGYDIVPTNAQLASFRRTGAVEPDYAFQFAATGLFTGGLSAASTAGRSAANRALFGQSAGRYAFTDGMEEVATAAAKAEGGRTLNMSPAGRALSAMEGKLPDVLTRRLWSWESRGWASGASGNVPFFTRGFPSNPGSSFVQDELPYFYRNPDVQSLTPRSGP